MFWIGYAGGLVTAVLAGAVWIFWEVRLDEREEHDELVAFREYWHRHTQP